MKIKDIVNRDIVNLKNCDQEPIHIPGSIQPHGFLLAIDKNTFTIRFCSGNVDRFIGLSHSQLLGKKITEIFENSVFENISQVANLQSSQHKIFKSVISGKEFEFVAHLSHHNIILEAEYFVAQEGPGQDLFDLSRQFMGYMEDAHTLVELCSLVAKGVRKITAYDRVMIYRFDREYNGKVIAEDKREDLEPFLGLHYPHTDIPVQARELYIKNLIRVIVDVQYTPVPVYTEDDGTDKNLDLSLSSLRSVSPIHIQYLHNMGVGATLTISLIHKGKLWGLIACHHYSPKPLTQDMRLVARLQGHFITSQIDVRQINEEYETTRKTNQALEALISTPFELTRQSLQQLVQDPNILGLCQADGVSIMVDQEIYKEGFTPENDEIRKLAALMSNNAGKNIFQTDTVIRDLPEWGSVSEKFPGIIYFPLDVISGNHILWYRSETIRQVNWAGDPNKAIEKDANGLSPRKSFELWKETVKYKSTSWLKSEINAATSFVNVLQKHLGSIYLAEEEEKQRQLALTLTEMNAELENINWLSTHDLQEPLRKIQFMASFVLEDNADSIPKEVYEKVERINLAAARMHTLIRDILKYTKLRHTSDSFGDADLGTILNDVVAELEDSIKAKGATVHAGKLPVVNGIPFLIKQVFANLIYNSLKFTASGRSSEIHVKSSIEEVPDQKKKFYAIRFSDNGIGFEQKYSETVFNIFTRLHSASEYPGSGVGLALCKKIMTTHEGFIKAEGVPGKGATFTLYFPMQ